MIGVLVALLVDVVEEMLSRFDVHLLVFSIETIEWDEGARVRIWLVRFVVLLPTVLALPPLPPPSKLLALVISS